MTEKIGKWALILGAVVNALLVLLGFLAKNEIVPLFAQEWISYPLLMCFPLFSAILCGVAAWLIGRKKQPDAPQEGAGMTVFFKSYLYLWSLATLLIAAVGFIFLNVKVASPAEMFCDTMCFGGLAWLAVVVVSILVWAAFNAWKSNELVGILIAVIAFALLVGGGALVGSLYNSDANRYYHPGYDYSDYYEFEEAEEAYPEPDDDYDDYAYDDEGVDAYENACRFMKFHLRIESSSDPVQLLRSWKLDTWHSDEYDSDSDAFEDRQAFRRGYRAFYNTCENSYQNSDELSAIADYYKENLSGSLNKKTFKKSGAKMLLETLLATHDDIYLKSNYTAILSDMYESMIKEAPEEDLYDEVVSMRYPLLEGYMTNSTLQKIEAGLGKHATDWENKTVAVWAYSFWARRYHDGVDATTYKILKMIDAMYN